MGLADIAQSIHPVDHTAAGIEDLARNTIGSRVGSYAGAQSAGSGHIAQPRRINRARITARLDRLADSVVGGLGDGTQRVDGENPTLRLIIGKVRNAVCLALFQSSGIEGRPIDAWTPLRRGDADRIANLLREISEGIVGVIGDPAHGVDCEGAPSCAVIGHDGNAIGRCIRRQFGFEHGCAQPQEIAPSPPEIGSAGQSSIQGEISPCFRKRSKVRKVPNAVRGLERPNQTTCAVVAVSRDTALGIH